MGRRDTDSLTQVSHEQNDFTFFEEKKITEMSNESNQM